MDCGRDKTGFWGRCKRLEGRFDSSPGRYIVNINSHLCRAKNMEEKIVRPSENRYPDVQKTVAVIGGILGLEPQYRRILEENNYLPRIYNQDSARLSGRVEMTDTIILFTGTVSHKMAEKVRKVAHLRDIPLVTVRRSSVSALKRSIQGRFISDTEQNQQAKKHLPTNSL
jgi:hypothetical protein